MVKGCGALDRCSVAGVTTNLELHRALLADAEFTAGGEAGRPGRYLARFTWGLLQTVEELPADGDPS